VLRLRQFQPADVPLITELCVENLRILHLNVACLFLTYEIKTSRTTADIEGVRMRVRSCSNLTSKT
jgi:hypothetical protein